MLDRESTFADEEVVELLKAKFVPVAIDQWYTRQQEDNEGRFYQAVAKQGPRSDMDATTQGFYICDAAGKLIAYNNNRHVDPIKKLLREASESASDVADSEEAIAPLKMGKRDPKFTRDLPEGATVVRVNSKVLEGYKKTNDRYLSIFHRAISRDNLWVLENEKVALARGQFPESLALRIARFHLIDNTRGEPTMWSKQAVKSLKIDIDEKGKVTGTATMESSKPETGFEVALLGFIQLSDDGAKIERFDLVAKGIYFGEGKWTKNAPDGKFPLAIAFRVADGTDVADSVAPQGTKGWVGEYLGGR